MRCVMAFALLCCLSGHTPLAAQRIDSLAAGAIVRVKLTSPRSDVVRGKYLARDSAGVLTIASDPGGTPVTVGLREIDNLEMRETDRTAGQAFGRGAAWGALTGLEISVALVVAGVIFDAKHPCDDFCFISNTAAGAVLSVPVMILSPVVGGLIGMSFRERWIRVRLTP